MLTWLKHKIGFTLKIAIAIFISGIGMLFVVELYSGATDYFRQRQYSKFEVPKNWVSDLSVIGFNAKTKTKLLDGMMYGVVELDGYPTYLTNPALQKLNATSGFTVEFTDNDGFVLHTESLPLSEFTTTISDGNKPSGLRTKFERVIEPDKYARYEKILFVWNFETIAPLEKPLPAISSRKPSRNASNDHCAPHISREERIRRLGLYGSIRQESENTYSVGSREVSFFSDGSVLYCH